MQKNKSSNHQIYTNKKQDSLAFELCQITQEQIKKVEDITTNL